MVFVVASALAGTECMSVDDFNTWMATHEPADTVTLSFDVTGVYPPDFHNTKGALAEFTLQACAEGAANALKVYGTSDEYNTSHPPGTLKQEYGYNCCESGDCGETWSDPNASEEIFVDGTETCDVLIWTDPDTFGYRLVCNVGTFEGVGQNDYDMPVDTITMFSLYGGSTWRIDNAVSTWNEVCFEAGDDVPPEEEEEPEWDGSGEIGVGEDVTVSSSWPDAVYPDPADLVVEAGDSEVYVMFDLSEVPGTITSATLHLLALDDGSAEGTGADVHIATHTSWSEDALTWDARPGASGAALDAVGPVEASQAYTLDVSAAVSSPGVYAFVLVPPSGDSNGAHFHSSESSVDSGPRLSITWIEEEDEAAGDTGEAAAGDTAWYDDWEQPTGRDSSSAETVDGCSCGGGGAPGMAVLMALAVVRRAKRPAGCSASRR